MKKLSGLIASNGLAVGNLYCVMNITETVIPSYKIPQSEIQTHQSRLKNTVEKVKEELQELVSTSNETDKTLGNILNAQIMMLSDSSFLDSIYLEIEKSQINAEAALKIKIDEAINLLKNSGDEYLNERTIDIKDAFEPVFGHLSFTQKTAKNRFEHIPSGAIIAAQYIKPSEAIFIKNANVAGIIMEEGGLTGHIAIMARAWDIPMLVDVKDCMSYATLSKIKVILDANKGVVLLNPPQTKINEYQKQIEKYNKDIKELLNKASEDEKTSLLTADGVAVSVNANIAFPEEVKSKFITSADGIGLFRSEFLFLENGKCPSEDYQFEIYKTVIESIGNKPVVIRTFDVGADKMIGEQKKLEELNPLLGWRGIRYCLERKEIFKTQIKAILRAAAIGNVYLLVPMVSHVKEIIQVKNLIKECAEECKLCGKKINENISVGIMIEVPSAAIAADLNAPYIDFMSIGTNDLIQYTMAADRENTKVSTLANYFEPSVLRLIKHVIDSQKFIKEQEGHLVSMCGEMAANEDAVFLLLGMGLRHFSMPAVKIPKMKKFIRSVNLKLAEQLYESIAELDSAEKIEQKVKEAMRQIT